MCAALLDADRYLCSVRTMYRILDANQEVRERRNQPRHLVYQKPALPVPVRIVPGPDIPIHRRTFADRLQDSQQMLPRDIERRVRLPAEIEQDFGFRFLQAQPPGNPLESLGIVRLSRPPIWEASTWVSASRFAWGTRVASRRRTSARPRESPPPADTAGPGAPGSPDDLPLKRVQFEC